MSIVKPKYDRLCPQKEYLTDEVVLIQAWKKSQRYIRKSNWYADLLELDQSAILLESWIKKWQREMETDKADPRPMRMVPAPKTHRWEFAQDQWVPAERKDNSDEKKALCLRPLAHLGIREQTMASAAMLCLADCIETAQGDSSVTDFFEARRRGIHSYGNRLYSVFDPDRTGNDPLNPRPLARFNWGNSEIYSRYSEDYRRFLERPLIIAGNVQDQLGGDEELFIVKLDISAFYDRIHRPTLIKRLKSEYEAFESNYTLDNGGSDDDFWILLTQILNVKWNAKDERYKIRKHLKDSIIPDGLPQGLVASDFFANAYLLDFDRRISGILKKRLSCEEVKKATKRNQSATRCEKESSHSLPDLPSVTLHDYCRYVDDIRLVVSVKGDDPSQKSLGEGITKWMNFWFDMDVNPAPDDRNSHRLTLNEGKTEVTPFSLMVGQSGITYRMSLIQGELSGPQDRESLQQTIAGLDALLNMADQFDCCPPPGEKPQHPLASIAAPKKEIRDDTLKRFVAYRLRNALRLDRSMTDLEAEIEPGVKARDAIDHIIEQYARKLVRAWSHDPSLSLVLRYGMDLFPSPELLQPVLDGLRGLIDGNDQAQAQALVAWYVCADLLRAGAMETGFKVHELEMPDTANLIGYRALLLDFAKEVLDSEGFGKYAPWYARQQALLVLAVFDPCPAFAPLKEEVETQHYRSLLLASAYLSNKLLTLDSLVLALVYQQLHVDGQRFARWFINSLEKNEENVRIERLDLVSFNRPDLMSYVLKEIESRSLPCITNSHGYLKIPNGMRHKSRNLADSDGEPVALWNVVTRFDNPFQQEIPWLKLAHALIKSIQTLDKSSPGLDKGTQTPDNDADNSQKRFSLHNITVTAKSWNNLKRPELTAGNLDLSFDSTGQEDPRLIVPTWCLPEKSWFYALGRMLRSAITGEQDFTLTPYLNRQDWDHYVGMRNSWYTRRLGMTHVAEALSGEAAPFSPWVSELLMRLLQWPGVWMTPGLIKNWEKIETLNDLTTLVKSRLALLETMYGKASGLPVYPIIVERDQYCGQNETMRVVLAQSLLPKHNDFTWADPCLNNPAYRARHRRHLSALCRCICTQGEAQRSVESIDKALSGKATADLIVLPELVVHPEDVWILKRLSDKTKAMIYFGMTPVEKPGGGLVNTACWLIPNQKRTGRSWIMRYQGKHHPTEDEKRINIESWRPYQVVIELPYPSSEQRGFRITGTICYDATDLNLAADMRNVSDMFVISAMNKDISTFDNMVSALHYHMYQHVVLVNTGEFGGSTVQAPFKASYEKQITHHHGGGQIGISVFDVDFNDFGPTANLANTSKEKKTKPAGLYRIP